MPGATTNPTRPHPHNASLGQQWGRAAPTPPACCAWEEDTATHFGRSQWGRAAPLHPCQIVTFSISTVTGSKINSEYIPNTPTNTLQSIGGVPETSAGTNGTKAQFSQKYTEIPVLKGVLPCQKAPKSEIQKISHHVTPVSVDENQSDTSSDY